MKPFGGTGKERSGQGDSTGRGPSLEVQTGPEATERNRDLILMLMGLFVIREGNVVLDLSQKKMTWVEI